MSLAPVISGTGVVAPTFEDILVYLQNLMAGIYGSDLYLQPDSQDGQFLAALAKLLKDENDAIIAALNAYSPATAQGAGLSSIVKINGVRRLAASNSQAIVTITGSVGTVINQGVVGDQFGTRWDLPAVVAIPDSGTVDATVTAETAGAFAAPIGALNVILTPTRGWQSVTNSAAGTPGAPVESDGTLRQRQASSTAIPALTVLAAMLGQLEALVGVGRTFIYENDTETDDANGLPPHSISAVVEGGDVNTIAQTISNSKTPGTTTYGSTAITVTNSLGVPTVINFYELALITVSTLIKVKSFTGYISTTGVAIQASVAEWLTSLAIGEDSYLSRIFSPANLTGDAAIAATGIPQTALDLLSVTYNITAIYQARSDMVVTGGPYAATATLIHVTNPDNYAIGQAMALTLDDGTFLYTSVSNLVGTALTMANAIPTSRSAINGALVYGATDVGIDFNEAATAEASDTILVVV